MHTLGVTHGQLMNNNNNNNSNININNNNNNNMNAATAAALGGGNNNNSANNNSNSNNNNNANNNNNNNSNTNNALNVMLAAGMNMNNLNSLNVNSLNMGNMNINQLLANSNAANNGGNNTNNNNNASNLNSMMALNPLTAAAVVAASTQNNNPNGGNNPNASVVGGNNTLANLVSAAAAANTLGAGAPTSSSSVSGSSSSSSSNPAAAGNLNVLNPSKLYAHVLELTQADKREAALLELSKKREDFPDLAPILWYSYGTISALLQEIVSIYPLLSPPRLTPSISNRCCNALALLQCVASHADTRSLFLNSHLGLFLYPFLNTTCTLRQYEYLRLTSLGVIGALVKMDDSDVINFLLQTEIIPLCLRIMDNGSELSKTVATFIIQKILLDEMGLSYICATYERFHTVSAVLTKMVRMLEERPSVRLLKHIVRCYLRLSENSRARDALRTMLPPRLRDNTFGEILKDDVVTKRWLAQLLYNIGAEGQ